eukprot:11281094-Alexandrium_andersonii.AAC.1
MVACGVALRVRERKRALLPHTARCTWQVGSLGALCHLGRCSRGDESHRRTVSGEVGMEIQAASISRAYSQLELTAHGLWVQRSPHLWRSAL